MTAFRIDGEFSCLCPMLSDEEREGLRASLKAHGCREPLVIWEEEGLLLDGHNRLTACREFGIHFETVAYSFPDRDAARNWIIDNALSRRNLSDEQRRYLRGKRLIAEKKPEGRPSAKLPQSEGETAERIAKRENVSRATVERDAQYARDVDKIAATAGGKVKRAILSGEVKLTREQVSRAAAKGVRNVAQLREVAKKRAPAKAREVEPQESRLIAAAERLSREIASVNEAGVESLSRTQLGPLWELRDEIDALDAAIAGQKRT